MLVPLPPELQQFVQAELASGKYPSEEALFCEGLRLLRQREARLEALRAEIAPAIEQLDRGDVAPLDPELIKAEGRRRLREAAKGD